jgi:hypothetical protein
MPYRQTFAQIFRRIDNNTLEVLKKIKVGSIELDAGAHLTRGILVAGLDFFKYADNTELEGEDLPNNIFDVKRVWR